jgi:hypothetical protein
VHDIVDLELRGVPSVMVASTEFIRAAEVQAEALGLDVRRVFVAHPIQDRTDEEMVALAESAVEDVVAALVTNVS